MNLLESLRKSPGFVYQIDADHYFLGKYICRPCDSLEITDTYAMYDLCATEKESQNAAYYFQKLRAYSDFALEPPFHATQHLEALSTLLDALSEFQRESLERQYLRFAEGCAIMSVGTPGQE